MEATFALFAQKVVVPDRGTLVADLLTLLVAAGRQLASPLGYVAVQFMLAMRYDSGLTREMHEQWAARIQTLRQVFDRAVARGEWPSDKDPWPLMQGLIGAVYLRVFMLREPVTSRHLRPIVESLLTQVGARAG